MPKKHPTGVRDLAVRLALGRLKDYPSIWAACRDLTLKLNIGAETLQKCVTQAQANAGERAGAHDCGARPSQSSIVTFILGERLVVELTCSVLREQRGLLSVNRCTPTGPLKFLHGHHAQLSPINTQPRPAVI